MKIQKFWNKIHRSAKNYLKKYFDTSNIDDPNKIYKNFLVPYLKFETSLYGYGLFNPDYKINFLFGFVLVGVTFYMSINLIDIWLIWGDFQRVCYCFVTWFFGWTSYFLAFKGISKKKQLCSMLNKIYEFGDGLKKETEKQEIEKFLKHSMDCKKLFLFTTVVCSGGGLICILSPLPYYLYTGELFLPLGFFIPGLSTTANPGYFVNCLYQIYQVFLAVLAPMQTTFHSYLLFSSNAFFQVDNLIIKLRKLNSAIEANPNEEGHQESLNELVKLHHRFQDFLNEVEDFYNKMFFVNIGSYAFMNVLILFVLVHKFWIVGYYGLVVLFGLIFLPCAIGTAIEVKNDSLINEIYCISWYSMIPKERKTYWMLFFGMQNTSMQTVGGLYPLNVETFRAAYSTIYTYLMFMIDMQK
ncbi:odorant receptor 43a-like [Culicoides brevitarsis]|uniref:odorant receptor 43a-like n=1 Tax=Culicoides brevitarsis TaxID=469753 RepID=UPI00307C741D